MLFYLSDCHPEIRGSRWTQEIHSFFEQCKQKGIPSDQVDVLLVGDNGSFLDHSLKYLIDAFAQKVRHVYFLLGNHEFQGLTFDMAITKAEELAKLFSNVTFLHRSTVTTADNIVLIGATLWTHSASWSTEEAFKIENSISDFHKIYTSQKVPWNLDSMNTEHEKDIFYIEEALKQLQEVQTANQKVVVATHFAPLLDCNPQAYKNSNFIKQFCNDVSSLIQKQKPHAWIQGHVHGGNDHQKVFDTIVSRACLGYYFEHDNGSIQALDAGCL